MNTKQFGIIALASIALLALLGCVSQCSIDTPELCNKSCSTDADCQWNCGGGCLNKNEIFDWKGLMTEVCPSLETGCSCLDNKCVSCVGESPAMPGTCCSGFTWMPPKESGIIGVPGYCTAKCGNGTCDEIESNLNCPADCEVEAGAGEQVIGPDYYSSEQQAFDAIAEEVDAMPELSDAELEALLGE